jgi:hypothetical protein
MDPSPPSRRGEVPIHIKGKMFQPAFVSIASSMATDSRTGRFVSQPRAGPLETAPDPSTETPGLRDLHVIQAFDFL